MSAMKLVDASPYVLWKLLNPVIVHSFNDPVSSGFRVCSRIFYVGLPKLFFFTLELFVKIFSTLQFRWTTPLPLIPHPYMCTDALQKCSVMNVYLAHAVLVLPAGSLTQTDVPQVTIDLNVPERISSHLLHDQP